MEQATLGWLFSFLRRAQRNPGTRHESGVFAFWAQLPHRRILAADADNSFS
jgi:hypothetical protein